MKKNYGLKKVLVLLFLSVSLVGGTIPNRTVKQKGSQPEEQVQVYSDFDGLDVGKAD